MKNKKPKEKKVKVQKVKKEKIEKAKKEREPLTLSFTFSLLGLSCIIIYLAIAIPMHLAFPGFSMLWFWFGFVAAVALVAPIGIGVEFVLPRNPNKKQFTAAVKSSILLTLFVWFFDLLYMAIFNRWIVWEYVFGLLAIVLLFTNLTRSFLSDKKDGKWILPFEFLADVGLSVYLIYRIPNDGLRTIITTVAAALFGGFLTLVGVAWTIRQGQKERAEDRKQLEEDRKQEEIRKAKPIFSYKALFEEPLIFSGKKICLPLNMPECKNSMNAIIENSNHSVFQLLRIFIDGKWYLIKGNAVILPESETILHFKFNVFQTFVLEILDTLGNYYYYILIPLKTNRLSDDGIVMHTLCEIYEISTDELKKRNIPLEDTP